MNYLTCPDKEFCGIGVHRALPITVKEFLKEKPECPLCGKNMNIVLKGKQSEQTRP